MKKFFGIYVSVAIFMSFFVLLSISQEVINNVIYLPNHEWKFSVKRSNLNSIDTLILNITDKPVNKRMNIAFMWTLITSDLKNKVDTLITQTIETSYESHYEGLSIPSMLYLKFSCAVPSPQIRLPAYIGYSMKSKSTFSMTDLDELKDETITGMTEVTDRIYYNNPFIKDSCWVLNAVGSSSIGTLNAKYYFHEKKGFVYLLYHFKSYNVEIELISYQ